MPARDTAFAVFLLVLGVVFYVGIWMFHRASDQERIRRHFQSTGNRILSIQNLMSRRYAVRYVDRDGNEHRVVCYTAGGTGVFTRDDRVIRSTADPRADLEDEVRRLRAENERLRRQLEDKDSTGIKES